MASVVEITAHIDASRRPTPRGTRTRQMARPSGTLWMASVVEMNMPNWEPEAPAKDTPIPTPLRRLAEAALCDDLEPELEAELKRTARGEGAARLHSGRERGAA